MPEPGADLCAVHGRNHNKENIEYRIMNVEGMYSIYFKMIERHAAQAPELRERHPSFDIRFLLVLVLVVVLDAVLALSISRTKTSTTTRTI